MNLSVDEADPAARLERIKATTSEVKQSPTAGLQYLMQCHVMPHLPIWVCREMVYGALATHTVVSNDVGNMLKGCVKVGGMRRASGGEGGQG